MARDPQVVEGLAVPEWERRLEPVVLRLVGQLWRNG